MDNYSNGKIYKIVCNITNDQYIGSTILSLRDRFYIHKSDAKNKNKRKCSCVDIILRGDCKILLIENYPCETKKQLERREGHFQKTLKCVNKRIAGLTPEEVKQNKKAYAEKHKEKTKEYNKQWRNENKEELDKKGFGKAVYSFSKSQAP